MLKKTVKLLALDLDGTLIREDRGISAQDMEAIARAQRAGVSVVIATGRTYPTAEDAVNRLRINTPVICSNGADVRFENKSIYSRTIENSWLRKAYRALEEYRPQRYIFCGDHVYCEKGTVNEKLYTKWGIERVRNGMVVYCDDAESLMETVGDGALKMIAITEDKTMDVPIAEMIHSLGYFDVVKGEQLHFELTRKGVTKASALEFVVKMLGVRMEEVMAIGDSTNDLEMIRCAGTGIAMGNSMPEVLAAADSVTLPVWENGVAHAIEQYIFQEDTCEVAG